MHLPLRERLGSGLPIVVISAVVTVPPSFPRSHRRVAATGLVGRALGVSLNLRVSQAATPTCRLICPTPATWKSDLQRQWVTRHGLQYRLNPAHVPYWRVNNPTLSEFCFRMIGRADIEGSKSNVAMNAWLPQASSFLPSCARSGISS